MVSAVSLTPKPPDTCLRDHLDQRQPLRMPLSDCHGQLTDVENTSNCRQTLSYHGISGYAKGRGEGKH